MGHGYRRFLLVRDDFYPDPHDIVRRARAMTFREHDEFTGYVTDESYCPLTLRRRLERLLGLRVTRWSTNPESGNGVFFLGLSRGKHREVPAVHYDMPVDEVTVVIYLTPGLAEGFGTSLWRHRSTGLSDAPTRSDARRLATPIAKLRKRLKRHEADRSKWVEIDRAGYRFNRMVAYPSGALHSATRHFGGSIADGRLYQTFRIGVSWRGV